MLSGLELIVISEFTSFLLKLQADLKNILEANKLSFCKSGRTLTKVSLNDEEIFFYSSAPFEVVPRRRKAKLVSSELQILEKIFQADLNSKFVFFPHFFRVTKKVENPRYSLILFFLVQKFLQHLQATYSVHQCLDSVNRLKNAPNKKITENREKLSISFTLAELAFFLQIKPRAENLNRLYSEIQQLSSVLIEQNFVVNGVCVEVAEPFILKYTKRTNRGRSVFSTVTLDLNKSLVSCLGNGFFLVDQQVFQNLCSNHLNCCKGTKKDAALWFLFYLLHAVGMGKSKIDLNSWLFLPKRKLRRVAFLLFLEDILKSGVIEFFGFDFVFDKKTDLSSISVSGLKQKTNVFFYKKV